MKERLSTLTKNNDFADFEDLYKEPLFDTPKTYNPEKHVQVRVLCSKDLPVDFSSGLVSDIPLLESSDGEVPKLKETFFEKMIKQIKPKELKKLNNKAAILHVHGGGFVSMSSGSHQNYTRVWANELNVPIFSVDYRLSP